MTDEEIQQYIDNESRYADSLLATAKLLSEAGNHIHEGLNVVKSLKDENIQLRNRPVAENDLFHFIEPSIIEYKDRLAIHRTIENLVKYSPLSAIWKYLKLLSGEGKIFLLDLPCKTIYDELVRMGMRGEGNGNETGYARKSFAELYAKETEIRKPEKNTAIVPPFAS